MEFVIRSFNFDLSSLFGVRRGIYASSIIKQFLNYLDINDSNNTEMCNKVVLRAFFQITTCVLLFYFVQNIIWSKANYLPK